MPLLFQSAISTRVTVSQSNRPPDMLLLVRAACILAVVHSVLALQAVAEKQFNMWGDACSQGKPCPEGQFCAYYEGPLKMSIPNKCVDYKPLPGGATSPPICAQVKAVREASTTFILFVLWATDAWLRAKSARSARYAAIGDP